MSVPCVRTDNTPSCSGCGRVVANTSQTHPLRVPSSRLFGPGKAQLPPRPRSRQLANLRTREPADSLTRYPSTPTPSKIPATYIPSTPYRRPHPCRFSPQPCHTGTMTPIQQNHPPTSLAALLGALSIGHIDQASFDRSLNEIRRAFDLRRQPAPTVPRPR